MPTGGYDWLVTKGDISKVLQEIKNFHSGKGGDARRRVENCLCQLWRGGAGETGGNSGNKHVGASQVSSKLS